MTDQRGSGPATVCPVLLPGGLDPGLRYKNLNLTFFLHGEVFQWLGNRHYTDEFLLTGNS